MKQLRVSVKNISNEHCHFERCIDLNESLEIPYKEITKSLEYLFQGLNVKIVFESSLF